MSNLRLINEDLSPGDESLSLSHEYLSLVVECLSVMPEKTLTPIGGQFIGKAALTVIPCELPIPLKLWTTVGAASAPVRKPL